MKKKLLKLRLKTYLLVISSFLLVAEAEARGIYLGWWNGHYSKSSSSDMNCQLCHEQTDGGNGWNYYGWTIRNQAGRSQVSSQSDFLGILKQVENCVASDQGFGCDVDNTQNAQTFFDLIRYNAQPGWAESATNITCTKDGNCLTSLLPPAIPATAKTTYDLASPKASPSPVQIDKTSQTYSLQQVATGFDQPIQLLSAPSVNNNIFVVERTGKVIRVDLNTGQKTVLLDDSSKLVSGSDNTKSLGLLGLAFHPNFVANGLFYTFQSRPLNEVQPDFSTMPNGVSGHHKSVIVEHNTVDPFGSVSTELDELLTVEQPTAKNNGGGLIFGQDGFLYVGLGDGGNPNDRGLGHGDYGNAQDPLTALGSVLRIDVNGSNSANSKYGIPTDNPFVGNSDGVDEIYAYGVRQPNKASINSTNGEILFADIGQSNRLEVNSLAKEANFGWSWKDGEDYLYAVKDGPYLSDGAPAGIPENLVEPLIAYSHAANIKTSAGFHYQGSAFIEFQNHYLFSNNKSANFNCGSSQVIAYQTDTKTAKAIKLATEVPGQITAIGYDANNEIYIVTSHTSSQKSGLFKLVLGDQPAEGLPEQCIGYDEFCVPIKSSNGKIAMICL